MQAIKKARKIIEKDVSKPFAQLLSKLIVALESEENFQLRQLYELNPSEFDLVIEILKEWRIDRHYMSKSKTFAAAFYGADLKK
jgi:L-2-hydroxyglutarate oxidase LhgO